jgi:hypothetical protein
LPLFTNVVEVEFPEVRIPDAECSAPELCRHRPNSY